MFKNLKIIELASVFAGPSTGMFFAELGAKVIKIENKITAGDITRKWKLKNEKEKSISAYFSSVNWGKEHVFLNLNDPEDKNKIHELIKEANIVISNFKSGDAEKFCLSFEDCKKINKHIIYAKLEGFKSNKSRVAYDVVIQAETGYMSMNGQPSSPPTKMPLAMMDILAAHQLKEGILVALIKQRDNPQAYCVETTLEEAAIASLANQAANYLMVNHIPIQLGSLHPNIAPYGEVITTKDQIQIVLAIGSDKQFYLFADLLKIETPLLGNFKTNLLRVKNRTELIQLLQSKANNIIAKELLNHCHKLNIPVGEIKNIKEVLKNKTATNMILEEKVENEMTKRVASIAFKIYS